MNFPIPSSAFPEMYLDKIPLSEVEKTAQFLGKHWYTDSPISNLLGMEGSPLEQQWMMAFVRSRLVRGIGIKAVKESGEFVGVILGHVTYRDLPEDPYEEELENFTSLLPKMALNLLIFQKLFEGVDLFTKYGVDRYFDLGRGYVVPEYRGNELSVEMAWALGMEAREMLGIQLFVAVPSGFYSQQILKRKDDLQLIKEVEYATFKVGDEYPFRNHGMDQSMQLWVAYMPLPSTSNL